MQAPEAERPHERPPSRARGYASRLADFLFVGAAILPPIMALGGHIDVALMAFCPLLFSACLLAVLVEDDPRL